MPGTLSLPAALLEPGLDRREERNVVVEVVGSFLELNFAAQDGRNVLCQDKKFVCLVVHVVFQAQLEIVYRCRKNTFEEGKLCS